MFAEAYSHLKKVIYAIEKATLGLGPLPDSHRDIIAAGGGASASPVIASHGIDVATDTDNPAIHASDLASNRSAQTAAVAGVMTVDSATNTVPPIGSIDTNHASSHRNASQTRLQRNRSTVSTDASRSNSPETLLTIDDPDTEQTPLLTQNRQLDTNIHSLTHAEANAYFQRALDEELDKIVRFYTSKERELIDCVNTLAGDVETVEREAEARLSGTSDPVWTATHFETSGDGIDSESANANVASRRMSPPQLISTAGAHQPMRDELNSATAASFVAATVAPIAQIATTDESAHASNVRKHHRTMSSVTDDYMTPDSAAPDLFSQRPLYLPVLLWSSKTLKTQRTSFEKRAISLFVVLCELRDYVDIHVTGFSKILKKYEKVVGAKMKRTYMMRVESSYPFLVRTKDRLARAIDQVVHLYARIATEGKVPLAQTELRSHLRDYIVWERNTIWRDMIEQERRRETIGIRANPMAGGDPLSAPRAVPVQVCGITVHMPATIPPNVITCTLAAFVLFAIIQSEPLNTPEQNGCLAILVFASVLWAFEALPLFITSMLVPVLVVALRVLRKDGVRLDSKAAAKQIFSDMFGPVIMLLLGGFSLAGALSKHNIAKEAASIILSRAGSRPHWVILANMFVSTFASMWISNVAAPVLCFSLITPILRNLPRKSPYARCLVMGIAMAANVGGMASPIASPQNIIAMANMNPPPSWIEWFVIALPICLALDAVIWLVLLAVYRPTESQSAAPPEIYGNVQSTASQRKLNATQVYVLCVCVLTIVLWCVESRIESVVGDMGVIAILPIVAFYGTGILTKDDWNSMLWSVVMLAMGGIALGKAVESSGLLAQITSHLEPSLRSLPMYSCLAILTGVVVVVTSFISHTVGALIILPVVHQIGATLPDPCARTFVMASALLCSGGMALPVSSFPNMNAISLEDPTGSPWLTVSDFVSVGVVSTAAAWVCVMTIGYVLMSALGFH